MDPCRHTEARSGARPSGASTRERRPGCHGALEDNSFRYVFRVYAPCARRVWVVSDFFGWDEGRPMTPGKDGFWELSASFADSQEGKLYKYKILPAHSETCLWKADPYARKAEIGGGRASVVCHGLSFDWQDGAWMAHREKDQPLHLYLLDPRLWWEASEEKEFSLSLLSAPLISYMKDMGYTHVGLWSQTSLSADGKTAAQVGNDRLQLPASLGTPEEWQAFVNRMHQNGLGVIFRLPPLSFLPTPEGLACFDGICLYEDPTPAFAPGAPDQGNPARLDPARPAARLLLSAAVQTFLLDYHMDGLILPRDYGPEGGGLPSFFTRDIVPLSGVRLFTESVGRKPVSAPPDLSLWQTQDFFQRLTGYLSADPFFRRFHHNALLESIPAPDPGRGSAPRPAPWLLPETGSEGSDPMPPVLQRLFGTDDQKEAALRLLFVCQMTFPGAKSTFMGWEFGSFAFPRSSAPLCRPLTAYEKHASFRRLLQTLDHIYLTHPALWSQKRRTAVFEKADDNLLMLTSSLPEEETVISVYNFSGRFLKDYPLPLPDGAYEILFATDGTFGSFAEPVQGRAPLTAVHGSLFLDIPPQSAVILQPVLNLSIL